MAEEEERKRGGGEEEEGREGGRRRKREEKGRRGGGRGYIEVACQKLKSRDNSHLSKFSTTKVTKPVLPVHGSPVS